MHGLTYQSVRYGGQECDVSWGACAEIHFSVKNQDQCVQHLGGYIVSHLSNSLATTSVLIVVGVTSHVAVATESGISGHRGHSTPIKNDANQLFVAPMENQQLLKTPRHNIMQKTL